MKNREKVTIAQLILATMIPISSLIAVDAHRERPNFLFIIIDDLRPVLGAYGDAKAHTPNIDLLARQSVVFERAYAQQALCSPSRNSLLTSRRPDDIGLYDFSSHWAGVACNLTTLPKYLKNNGYVTSGFGKVFHPGVPMNKSCDHRDSWSEPPFYPSTEKYKDAPVCRQGNSTPDSNLICPVRVSEMPNATLPDLEILQAAKEFLNKQRREPFFLAVGFHKPHIPLKYPKKYLKFHPLKKFSLPRNYEWLENVSNVAYNPWTDLRRRSDVRKLGLNCPWEKIPEKFAIKIIQSYYAAVTYIDELIGKLLRKIDNLKIRGETIVILTSDHGWSLGEHAVWSKYSNFEVAVRVPLIISVPHLTHLWKDSTKFDFNNRTQRNVFNNHAEGQPVELLDIFPTVAELAGFPIPTCPEENTATPRFCTMGSSLIPLITASTKTKSRSVNRTAISQYPRPGVDPVCNPSSDKPRLRQISVMGYTIRTVQYRYTAWVNFSQVVKLPIWQSILAEELYDHYTDSSESSNLASIQVFQHIKYTLKLMLMEKLKQRLNGANNIS
ncbi:iduronate 2-sulfatase [Copidosoma floridanum]|uniref:iduronate 2-sulfatase n=1 Tax=Copidosoma floridanum TaxID=29053 RepID=UPI000C6F73CC|nr:iduronate 2-sulfatase [Copidosoma floridanum]